MYILKHFMHKCDRVRVENDKKRRESKRALQFIHEFHLQKQWYAYSRDRMRVCNMLRWIMFNCSVVFSRFNSSNDTWYIHFQCTHTQTQTPLSKISMQNNEFYQRFTDALIPTGTSFDERRNHHLPEIKREYLHTIHKWYDLGFMREEIQRHNHLLSRNAR